MKISQSEQSSNINDDEKKALSKIIAKNISDNLLFCETHGIDFSQDLLDNLEEIGLQKVNGAVYSFPVSQTDHHRCSMSEIPVQGIISDTESKQDS